MSFGLDSRYHTRLKRVKPYGPNSRIAFHHRITKHFFSLCEAYRMMILVWPSSCRMYLSFTLLLFSREVLEATRIQKCYELRYISTRPDEMSCISTVCIS